MSKSEGINFGDYISGEELLSSAAKSVRSLNKDVTALSKTVGEDAARIKAGFGEIANAIRDLQGKGVKLNLVSPEDKKLLADYIAQVGDLRAAQAGLKEQEKATVAIQKTLADASKVATMALKEQQVAFKAAATAGDTEAQKKAAVAIQEIAASSEAAGRALRGANSEFTAATGSINELRLQLSKGTASYIALTKAERESAKGTELRDSVRKTSDELKKLEKALGDTRRNVGNYGNAFKEVAGTGLLPFSNSINNAIQAADGLKKGLESARKGLYGMREGGAAAGEGLNIVKVGIASTGIGLLLIALVTLYEYFSKTDDGAETLAAGLAFLKGAFGVLEGVVVSAGRGLSLVFTDPMKAGQAFLDFLKSQVINRLKAFSVIAEGFSKGNFTAVANGILQLNTGVENVIGKTKRFIQEAERAGGVAGELSRAGDRLEDLEIANIARTEIQAQLAAKLLLTFKDKNLTEAQRLTNLDEAGRLEKNNLENALFIENKRLAIIRATNAESIKKLGIDGIADADRRKEEEQVATVARLKGETAQKLQIIDNRKSLLQKQERAEDAAAAKKARDEELERQREVVRARQVQLAIERLAVKEGSAEELALKKRELQAKRDLDLINDKLTANGRALLRETERVDEHKADVEFRARKAAEEAKDLADRKQKATEIQAIVEEAYQAELTTVQNALKGELAALGNSLANGEIMRAEYERRVLAAKQDALNKEITLNRKFDKDSADAEKRKDDLSLDQLKTTEAKRKAVLARGQQQATALAQEFFTFQSSKLNAQGAAEEASYTRNVKAAGDNKQLLAVIEAEHQKKVAAIQRKQAENERRQALFSIAINTAQAIMTDAKFGFPASIPLIAADVALGAAQAAAVLSQPLPEFFRGRKGGAAVPLASVAERGAELIERANGPVRFEYAAKPGLTSLGAGDSVYTAAETARMLATAGLSQSQAMQPGAVAAAFSGAARDAHMARTAGPDNYGKLSAAVEANTAALSKIKPVVVNVGPGSDASVQTSAGITHYLNQRTFGK